LSIPLSTLSLGSDISVLPGSYDWTCLDRTGDVTPLLRFGGVPRSSERLVSECLCMLTGDRRWRLNPLTGISKTGRSAPTGRPIRSIRTQQSRAGDTIQDNSIKKEAEGRREPDAPRRLRPHRSAGWSGR
jgi:hypothetical protein